MSGTVNRSLFLFRRDLRLEDNTGILFALRHSQVVIPAFIFTSEQIQKNRYRNDHCLKFMIESLEDLHDSLERKGSRLYLFEGENEEIIDRLIQSMNIDAVIVNRDYTGNDSKAGFLAGVKAAQKPTFESFPIYTPYSRKWDEKIKRLCEKRKIAFHLLDDLLFHPPEATVKKEGSPYTTFTPYFRHNVKSEVPFPVTDFPAAHFFKGEIPFAAPPTLLQKLIPTTNNGCRGGRKEGLKILKHLDSFSSYDKERDFPAKERTTHLSAHLNLTTLSPREVFHAINKALSPDHGLIRSLYWRDFFISIAFFFPHVFGSPFHKKFEQIRWSENQEHFAKWTQGMTGFPIVDAGMRELNQTGFMHNRVRMITASFLTKDLHIDWRWGESYFATQLVDYDPAVNNGNWQWVAGTGTDAQPYFRVFNPWTQQKKFDPDCLYTKQWIPELKSYPSEQIHHWNRKTSPFYPPPMVDHGEEAKKAISALALRS